VLQSRDFRRARRGGKRLVSTHFAVSVVPRPDGAVKTLVRKPCLEEAEAGARLGITVSRKVGNAVVRNRIKRSVREWFRSERGGFTNLVDVVVVARRGASGKSMMEISRELGELLRPAMGSAPRKHRERTNEEIGAQHR
jgi:ribonuclease P protein component